MGLFHFIAFIGSVALAAASVYEAGRKTPGSQWEAAALYALLALYALVDLLEPMQ